MIYGHVRDYMPRVSLMLPGINGPTSVDCFLQKQREFRQAASF